MMTDRELLELAAKAAGLNVIDRSHPVYLYIGTDGCKSGFRWNPLADDGDALRLAVQLRIYMLYNRNGESPLWVSAVVSNSMLHGAEEFQTEGQREAATRRAIVRAAAEIGKAME